MSVPWWIAELIVTTALLAVVVEMVCRLLPHRPAVRHLLWLVVLAKFLTPPWIGWQVPVPRWLEMPARIETAGVETAASEFQLSGPTALPLQTDTEPVVTSPPVYIEANGSAAPIAEAPAFPAAEESVAAAPIVPVQGDRPWTALPSIANVARALGALWLSGALVAAWHNARRIARHARLLGNPQPTPEWLAAEVAGLAQRLGVRPIRIRVVEEAASPFVWCLGRATLVWPASMADPANLAHWRGVIAHELAHVRRRDHWTVWLELLAGIAWWWNPVMWFVRRRLRQSAEAACDALAIDALPAGRRAYAEAFLELSQLAGNVRPSPALGVGWHDETSKSFERRLAMILSERVKSRASLPGLAAAVVLALVALPTWSLGQAEPPAEKTVEPAPKTETSPAVDGSAEAEKPTPPTESAEKDSQPVTFATPPPTPEVGWECSANDLSTFSYPGQHVCRIQVDAPEILAVTALTDHSFQVRGKRAGTATISVSNETREIALIRVTVRPGTPAFRPPASQPALTPIPDIGPHDEIRQSSAGPVAVRVVPGATAPTYQPGVLPPTAPSPAATTPPALFAAQIGPVAAADPPLGPDVIGRFGDGLTVAIDPDLRPDVKFEMFQYASIEVKCPEHKINRVKVAGEDVLLIRNQNTSGFRVSAKKVGTGKIALFDDAEQFGTVEIVVLAPPTAAVPIPYYASSPQPVLAPLPAVAASPPVAAQNPTRVAPDSDGESGAPEFPAARSAQFDLTNLGVAIIEAQGALELAKMEAEQTKQLYDKKAVSSNEVKLHEIKAQTAEQKLQFLKRMARIAYESARQDLGLQTAAFQRVNVLSQAKQISTEQFDQAQRELKAVKDKVLLLETIPGIEATKAPDAPAKAD